MVKNRVAEYRKSRGLTQRQLAAAAKTSQQQVQRVEAGATPRFDLALRLCAALDEPMERVFPSTKSALTVAVRKGSRTVDDLLQDRQVQEEMEQAGIDMDPAVWTFRYHLRGGAKGSLAVGGLDRKRLWRNVQADGHDTNPFVVFDSGGRQVAINRHHLLYCHFLFDPPYHLLSQEHEAVQEDGEREDDSGGLLVYLTDSPEPIGVDVEPDTSNMNDALEGNETDDDAWQLQSLFFELESWDAQDGPHTTVAVMDVDGETAFFRLADVAMVSVPLKHVNPSIKSDSDSEETNQDAGEGQVSAASPNRAVAAGSDLKPPMNTESQTGASPTDGTRGAANGEAESTKPRECSHAPRPARTPRGKGFGSPKRFRSARRQSRP
jgi:transcriptional regulator with XRE-family HTH domain